MGLEAVGDLALHKILTKLDAKETTRVGCLSKRLKASAYEDSLWAAICSRDLNLSEPRDPNGNLVSSFAVCYRLWRDAFRMYPWPLVGRVKRCWDRLRYWLKNNFPEAEETLCEGATEAEIQELEKVLGLKLPTPTRILYRFCNGQEFKNEDMSLSRLGSALGVIGGYSFYNHLVNVYLLSISQVILETQEVIHHLGFSSRPKYVVVAASSTFSEKLFFLDCTNGQLYVGTRNLPIDGEMLPCVPSGLLQLGTDNQQDAMLLWLEEHCRRLEDGIIKVQEEGEYRSICLFPEEPPLCSTAVTNGIQVRASAVFVPELADLQDDQNKYLFTYSIRMSLLPDGCFINGMHFSSCQLHWRHWIIRAGDNVVSDVIGEAVIGKFPLLRPGEEEFVYQSCTPLPTSPGSVEGSFTFVPGSLAIPKGSPFEVSVARFPLQLPDYVY